MPKQIEYLYENESDGFRFRFRAKWNQLFRRKSEKEAFEKRVSAELEYIDGESFESLSRNDQYRTVFDKYLTDEEKSSAEEMGMADVSRIADVLKPTRSNRRRADSFATLISDPLARLSELEEGSEEYREALNAIAENAGRYVATHNPFSDAGKARVEFAMRLKYMANAARGIDAGEEEEMFDDEIAGLEEAADLEAQVAEAQVKAEREPAAEREANKENPAKEENPVVNPGEAKEEPAEAQI